MAKMVPGTSTQNFAPKEKHKAGFNPVLPPKVPELKKNKPKPSRVIKEKR